MWETWRSTPPGCRLRTASLLSVVNCSVGTRVQPPRNRWVGGNEACWATARRAHGDAGGTRALAEVLLHRHLTHTDAVTGLHAAVAAGAAVTADVVAVEARKAADQRGKAKDRAAAAPPSPTQDRPTCTAQVVSLTKRRLSERLGDPGPAGSRGGHAAGAPPAADQRCALPHFGRRGPPDRDQLDPCRVAGWELAVCRGTQPPRPRSAGRFFRRPR